MLHTLKVTTQMNNTCFHSSLYIYTIYYIAIENCCFYKIIYFEILN